MNTSNKIFIYLDVRPISDKMCAEKKNDKILPRISKKLKQNTKEYCNLRHGCIEIDDLLRKSYKPILKPLERIFVK